MNNLIPFRVVDTPTTARLRQEQAAKRNNRFLKGPVPMAWLEAAANLPGSAVKVSLQLWHHKGLNRSDTFSVNSARLVLGSMSPDTIRRALKVLEEEGLISVERPPGRKLRITLHKTSVQDWTEGDAQS